jgi:gluconate 2-dehydrogenase gamma chain
MLRKTDRRQFLRTTALGMILLPLAARATEFKAGAGLPWEPYAGEPPTRVSPIGWLYFTPDEARSIEAIVDRLIPEDNLSLGGKSAGCAVFIDRQLAGPFGDSRRLYMRPPFLKGLATQGSQSPLAPASRYRAGLAALNASCKQSFSGRAFFDLPIDQQNAVLHDMEAGKLALGNDVDAKSFFEMILQNTMEGFFADPIYGGNRDMTAWKMIGFPGARYDYRDFVEQHNKPYPLPPVSLAGRTEWMPKG